MGQSSSKQHRFNMTAASPPPYEDHFPISDQQPRYVVTKAPTKTSTSIKATDTPQWLWTNEQCRDWVTEVLVHYCKKRRPEAEWLAREAMEDAFGPRLFSNNQARWVDSLGQGPGECIFDLICSMRRQEGALPPGLVYPHYERDAISEN